MQCGDKMTLIRATAHAQQTNTINNPKNEKLAWGCSYFIIEENNAYFISRLKLNTRIYQKNKEPEYFQNGTLKKYSEYIQLDMEGIKTLSLMGMGYTLHY